MFSILKSLSRYPQYGISKKGQHLFPNLFWLLVLLLGGLPYAQTVACITDLDPSRRDHSATAGTGTVNVDAPVGCTWSASSNETWITITFGKTGKGDGTVAYSIEANASKDGRSGTITIGGKNFLITQPGILCEYEVVPVNKTHSAKSGNGEVSVKADPIDCEWTANSNASWINVTGISSVQGHGTVTYEFMANPSPTARSGKLTVAGREVTITQLPPQPNQAPQAKLIANPSTGLVVLTANLDASQSFDPDGRIVDFAWLASDGQTATGKTATFAFSTPGDYSITLTVTDDGWLGGPKTATVTQPIKADPSMTCLTNISTRAPIEGGIYNVIAGFVITGTGTQQVVIRGWGLETSVDPYLLLQKYPSGDPLASNNDWQTDPRRGEVEMLPAHLRLNDSTDTGLFRDLSAGAYTATLSSIREKGLGLLGVDATIVSCNQSTKIINISTRAPIRGGAYDVIAGFTITGEGTQQVLIRGWGLDSGVNPKLNIQKYPSGDDVTSNDDWQDGPRASEIAALPAHLQLGTATDAGLLLDLPAGAYTAILSSVGSKGLGLIGVDAIN